MKVLLSTPTRFAAQIALLTLALLGAVMAAAQQPSQGQASAIRSNCRSDYRSHCASVPTGGPAALQCLQKNVASLSPSCQWAVNEVGGGAPAAPSGVRCAGDATHRSASSVCHRGASWVCSASRPPAERSDNAVEQITSARGARSGRRAGAPRHRDTSRRRDFYVLDRPRVSSPDHDTVSASEDPPLAFGDRNCFCRQDAPPMVFARTDAGRTDCGVGP
jgi:hypothetical protein